MKQSEIDQLFSRMEKSSGQLDNFRKRVPEVQKRRPLDLDEDEYMPVGVGGLLAASEKLLAINKGLDKTDERDSLVFKRIMTTDKLLSERIELDNNKVRQKLIPRIAKAKSLLKLHPFAFDNYMEGHLLGNPLSSPLEEINPLHLVEQARRISAMGPGGIGSDNAVTEDMQAVRGDQFGYLSVLEGPETFHSCHWLLSKTGWKRVYEVTMDDLVACNINGSLEFHKPTKLHKYNYTGDMILAENANIKMCVTPNHRLVYASRSTKDWSKYKIETAANLYGKNIRIPCWHAPYVGSYSLSTITIGKSTYNICDFAAWLGWYLSEGSVAADYKQFKISQCSLVNIDNFYEINELLNRMEIDFSTTKYGPYRPEKNAAENGFWSSDADLLLYIKDRIPGGRLCDEKSFPLEAIEWPEEARIVLLDALLKGDGRCNKTHTTYCSTSKQLAEGVELLMISLGYPTKLREEPDKRAHVKTTNWCVAKLQTKEKTIIGKAYGHKNYPDRVYGNYWSKLEHDDYVYSVSVPGTLVFTKGSEQTQGAWSGNSEKIGIDVRAAWNTRIGSDGKLYQMMYDRKKGKHRWLSPEDLDGSTVKLPD
jgi:hypothetical protein